jgi:hypothetical protein
MAVEPRRGCGYRKIGGLYLVCPPGGMECDRLPHALTVCPVCSCGIKQTRGFTWIDVGRLFGGPHAQTAKKGVSGCYCESSCPLCSGNIGRGGLLWIGEAFYPTPTAFKIEANRLGISRRITALPRDFALGETWILLGHPKAAPNPDRDPEAPAYLPGIFMAFRPTAVEKILAESDRSDTDKIANLEKAGVTPVFVPDNDKDHRGSAHDKGNGKQPALDLDDEDEQEIDDEPPPDLGPHPGAIIREEP